MPIKKITNWVRDYFYLAKGHAFMFRKPPKHYLGYISGNKPPIILIPGVYSKWQFLKAIADPISLKGHPVYAVENLGYNTKAIDHSAKLIRELINEKNLHNVIIIAHSKGGLIAEYLLTFNNQDGRVIKVIAIATPFLGSHAVKLLPCKAFKEIHPESEVIKLLNSESAINHKIVSIFGEFDNHVWPTGNCRLEGAKNIQVNVYGHHKILFNKHVLNIVLEEIEKV
ncbi:MAG: alpha/beta hydrolase [Candidatus Moranbacteria bacterium]|nr:alpha/beta hydrolase [Candidatus Moranbacteria bacterium]